MFAGDDDNGYCKDLWGYNIKTNKWSELMEYKETRFHKAIMYQHYLIVLVV